jgi:hypothetical protein
MAGTKIADIVAAADAARAGLGAQEAALQAEIQAVDDIVFQRPLTAAEGAKRQDLRAAQTACRAAQVELSFVTLQALDQSTEVTRLINAFKSVNQNLADAHQKLEKISAVAKEIEAGAAAVAQVAGQLVALAAKFP